MAVETRERVYQFLCTYVDEHNMPPALQDIAEGIGVSKAAVHRAIDILEARGKVKRERFKARTVLPIR